jgi:hypothetical protein
MKNWDVGLRDLYDHENGRGHDKVNPLSFVGINFHVFIYVLNM